MTVLVALREGRLRASDRLAAFVYGVARNVVDNHLREGQQHPTDDAVTPDMCHAVSEYQVEMAERASMLRRALEGLASIERRILLLTLVDGLKPGAIAERLGLTSEVVRARKSRALKKVVAHVGRLSDRGWAPPSIPVIELLNQGRDAGHASPSSDFRPLTVPDVRPRAGSAGARHVLLAVTTIHADGKTMGTGPGTEAFGADLDVDWREKMTDRFESSGAKRTVVLLFTAALGVLAAAPAQAQGRVPGFRPSRSGFHFINSFASVPYFNIDMGGGTLIPIGDASNGMCGGMVYAVRDYYERGLPPPPNKSAPSSGPLFNYLSTRLLDSFNLPIGPAMYRYLMDPNLPDHETIASSLGLAPHGRAWVMIVEQWPQIRQDLDQGRLSPLGLIRVKTDDLFQMGLNHQVLAYAYTLNGTNLAIHVYDPNYPDADDVTLSLDISNPWNTTAVTYSTGEEMFAFFRSGYGPSTPPPFAIPATRLTADFTGDGRTDVLLTGPAGWNTLPLARSLGNGEFYVTNTFVGGFAAWSSDLRASRLVGDFNGDGRADIALTGSPGWNTLPVAFSNGYGSFTVTNTYIGAFAGWASDREATKLVGDFNGDGKADIALCGPPGWNTLPVAFSNGNGSFTVRNVYIGDFAGWASDLNAAKLSGDFNGDGRTDVALTGPTGWETVPIAFSNGDGSFSVTDGYVADFASRSSLRDVVKLVGDFDGDGTADIALTGRAGWGTMPIAFSDGAGGFQVTNTPAGAFPFRASERNNTKLTGDFNGDGRADFAVVVPGYARLPMALSNAGGGFSFTEPLVGSFGAWAGDPQAVALKGDFNGDGRTDVGLMGPGGWNTLPVAFATPENGFSVTNGWVGGFAVWGSQPFAQ